MAACLQHGRLMPRALLLLSVFAPALALGAPAAGDAILVTSDSSDLQTINRAQCNGTTRNDDVGITDDVTADITWTIQPVGSSFETRGDYKIYVSTQRPAAGQKRDDEVQTNCTTNLNGDAITPHQVVEDIAVSTSATTTRTGVSLAEIASEAGVDCAGTLQPTVYVCVQQVEGATILGYAITALTLDSIPPSAPTDVRATVGDSVLHVSCDRSSSGSGGTFKAKATPQNAGKVRFSGESSSCSGLTIEGLTNNEPYDVVVYQLDDSHNPSDASVALEGAMPIPTDDYWNHYDGQETGGCSTAAGAAGLLGALATLATLAALRRRKS